jgi:hypothetical protein
MIAKAYARCTENLHMRSIFLDIGKGGGWLQPEVERLFIVIKVAKHISSQLETGISRKSHILGQSYFVSVSDKGFSYATHVLKTVLTSLGRLTLYTHRQLHPKNERSPILSIVTTAINAQKQKKTYLFFYTHRQ